MKQVWMIKSEKGFTLIEIIIGIMLAAILGTMLVMVVGDNLARSTVPVTTVDDLLLLQEEMEAINARYYSELATTGSMVNFQTFLNSYSSSNFTLTTSNFLGQNNDDIQKVELTSNSLGVTLVTLMADVNN